MLYNENELLNIISNIGLLCKIISDIQSCALLNPLMNYHTLFFLHLNCIDCPWNVERIWLIIEYNAILYETLSIFNKYNSFIHLGVLGFREHQLVKCSPKIEFIVGFFYTRECLWSSSSLQGATCISSKFSLTVWIKLARPNTPHLNYNFSGKILNTSPL